jgi:hypothetical protein
MVPSIAEKLVPLNEKIYNTMSTHISLYAMSISLYAMSSDGFVKLLTILPSP